MLWFTANLHFGDEAALNRLERPFTTVDHMDESLIQNWNTVVAKEDTVYVLGGFAACNRAAYCSELRGHIVLIGGDDHELTDVLQKSASIRDAFGEAHAVYFTRAPNTKQHLWLARYPHIAWPKMQEGTWHLYGHPVNTPNVDFRCCMCVNLDAHRSLHRGQYIQDYAPYSYDEIKRYMAALADPNYHAEQ